ncbi:MAG TPA: type II toxin-antitoxin system VapC family toxin [Acidimicrobiales bacterium]
MTVVVDASALVELLLRTPTGLALEGRLLAGPAQAPDIIDAEVAAGLRRAWRQGAVTAGDTQRALERLLDWPGRRIPTRLLVRRSQRWWGNVSAYNSLYLAVAHVSGASILTCDGRLSRAPGTGVPVENVRVG